MVSIENDHHKVVRDDADRFDLRFDGGRRSVVIVGEGALERISEFWRPQWEAAAVIGDRTVVGLFGERLQGLVRPLVRGFSVLDFPDGEASKSRRTKADLEDRMLDAGFGRQTCVVAVGGGVSLDLAGFVAATYLRGVDSIYIPTTLLAQVDASIGGKTGVNTAQGKNLIGAFHQPSAVLLDPSLPASQAPAQWRNGLAELVKHAVIADGCLFEKLEEAAERLAIPGSVDADLLRRGLDVKVKVVTEDEREAGRRAILNFGHTAGHAIEKATGHGVAHGIAVVMGMRIEARLAMRRCGLDPSVAERLDELCSRLGFSGYPAVPFESAERFLWVDKKNRGGSICASLPSAIGEMAQSEGRFTLPVQIDEFREVWDDDLR